jgi:hypothetical protein
MQEGLDQLLRSEGIRIRLAAALDDPWSPLREEGGPVPGSASGLPLREAAFDDAL